MYDGLVRNVVPLLLRLTLAVIFLMHGWHKVFDVGNEAGLAWARELTDPPSRGVQLLLAWGELVAGVMMLGGFATRLAAVAVIAAVAGEVYATRSVHGWSATAYGFEYIFAVVMIAACLLITGAGRFSLVPHVYWPRRRVAPVRAPEATPVPPSPMPPPRNI